MFIKRPMPAPLDASIREALSDVCTSTLGHLRDHGFPTGLSPMSRPIQFVGCAVTVRIPHMDSTAVHVAVDMLRPGDVLVVDNSGDVERSCFGGMVAFTAKAHGAVGALLSGPANDRKEILEYGLPVYSRGISSHTTRLLGIEGAINIPVTVGGAVIHPGDVVWADDDGVAILTRDEAPAVAKILLQKEQAEPAQKEAILSGKGLGELSGAISLFADGDPD